MVELCRSNGLRLKFASVIGQLPDVANAPTEQIAPADPAQGVTR